VSAALELAGVTVRYPGAARAALDAVSLAVGPGECVAIAGPNGAGKTSVLRALLGVVPVASGAARVLGRDPPAGRRDEMARAVSVVAQREEPAFPVTVGEVVAMGRYPHLGPWQRPAARDRAAVSRAMERTDVVSLADRWVGTLSGGEWQRVRLARALAQEPRALLLDEPTSSLDMGHEMELLETVRGLAKNDDIAALVISHSLNLAARFADRLVLLDRGRVAADDVPARVLDASLLSRVFDWPVAVHQMPDGASQLYPLRRNSS